MYACAYQRGGGGVCTERMRGVAINEDKYALPYMDINTTHVPYMKTSC